MKKSILRDKTKTFALRVITVCDTIDPKKNRNALTSQIVRSATSIGANIHEAGYGESRADFIHKLQIALKECCETEYWLEILQGCGAISNDTAKELLQECGTIHAMLASSIRTAKKNRDKEQ